MAGLAVLAALAGLLLGSTGRKDALQQAWRSWRKCQISFSLKSLKYVKAETTGEQRLACSLRFTAVLPPGVQLARQNNKENGGGGGTIGPYQCVKAGLMLIKSTSLAFEFKVEGMKGNVIINKTQF